MKSDDLRKAIGGIDEDLIESADKAPETAQRKIPWIKWGSFAAAFVIVATVSIMFISGIIPSPSPDTPSTIESAKQVTAEVTQNMQEPTTGHNIGIKCSSFYTDRKITLDVFMNQYVSGELDGYPVFEVYQGFPEHVLDVNVYKEGHNVIVNGSEDGLEKRFTLDDLSFLSASYGDDAYDGHGEKVTLDFSKFDPNEAVTVTFSYGFFYYKNNPYNQPQPDNSWCGRRVLLNFYIGDNGIAVSANSTEDALTEYERMTGIKPELWQYIDELNRSGETSFVTHNR